MSDSVSVWGESLYEWNSGTASFSSPYRFNGKELDQETGLAYYGARYYDNKISMWLSVDPLAMERHNITMTPYHFSSNNPIMRVDPDGLSDYFTEDGTYLGSDNSDMDDVRVMSQEVWNQYSTETDQGVRSIDEGVGINGSKLASESGLSNDAQLGIYEHYNPTDLDLVAHGDPRRVGLTFSGKSDGSAVIKVKLEGNMRGKIIDHSSEITSMYAHEKKHYSDFKELGFEEYQASSEDWREQRAYHAQVSDPSWSRTRPNYRRAVLQGAEQYGYSPPIQLAPKSIQLPQVSLPQIQRSVIR